MTKLVETIAKSLVEHPEKVDITRKEGQDGVVLQLHVADDDMGRVIGKQGRIARALRTVVKAAAMKQNGGRCSVPRWRRLPLKRWDLRLRNRPRCRIWTERSERASVKPGAG